VEKLLESMTVKVNAYATPPVLVELEAVEE